MQQLRSGAGRYPGAALLEPLAVDSVYSIKDEFDRGIDENLWTTTSSTDVDRGFEWDSEDPEGSITCNLGNTDDAYASFFSRLRTWNPGNRCAAQIRLNISPAVTTLKFEFGFVNPILDLVTDAAEADGAVLVKATPTANMANFGVVVYDTDDDTNLSVVAATRNTAVSSSDQSSAEEAFTSGEHSLLVWINEHNSVNMWYDGRAYANVTSQVGTPTSSSGPNITGSTIGSTSGSHLWIYLQNRGASSSSRQLTVDYIQAWQERTARNY